MKDEALVAMKLVHPNIVQIRAFEENNGNPFLVMDYVDGETLDEYLAEHIGTTSASAAVNAPAARSTSGTGGSPVLSGLPGAAPDAACSLKNAIIRIHEEPSLHLERTAGIRDVATSLQSTRGVQRGRGGPRK